MMASNGRNYTTEAISRIQRFNPDADQKPYLDTFVLPVMPDTTILDALEAIKADQDGTLTFRRSCSHAICGSCALNVNGHNRLACNQPVLSYMDRKKRLTLRPLPYLPILKDLVVDRARFWQQYQRIKPWLVPPANAPATEYRVLPAEVEALRNAEKCIMCGACFSACQVVALNKNYLGPHALLKAFLRILDPRDSIMDDRIALAGTDEGVFRCHTIFNCIDACPKQLNPTDAIETLRKLVQKRVALSAAREERQRSL
jgi:succinate dehydrogenase / fumarate reductase iron-sulfur subunit